MVRGTLTVKPLPKKICSLKYSLHIGIIASELTEVIFLEFLVTEIELEYLTKKALHHYISIANHYFNQRFSMPSLSFKLTGKAAGKAYLQNWEIRLNPILFKENKHAFIEEVVPHEFAHLLAYKLFGRVRPHGPEWKLIMATVFSISAKTTHSFNIQSVQGRTFEYRCQCHSHSLSIRRHNKVQRGTAKYSCRNCKQELNYIGIPIN